MTQRQATDGSGPARSAGRSGDPGLDDEEPAPDELTMLLEPSSDRSETGDGQVVAAPEGTNGGPAQAQHQPTEAGSDDSITVELMGTDGRSWWLSLLAPSAAVVFAALFVRTRRQLAALRRTAQESPAEPAPPGTGR